MHPEIQQFITDHANCQFDWPTPPSGDINTQFAWIQQHSNIPWLEIVGIDAPYAAMLAEAKSLRSRFVEHRASEQHQGWMSLCVHGISAEHTTFAEAYGLDPAMVKYDWTDIQDHCPVTVKFFQDQFPYKSYQRVRYMLLQPGGYIAPHCDFPQNSVINAVNISLNHPKGCVLVTEHGTVPFKDSGSIFAFNNHYHHAVTNPSNQERYHIIAHGEFSNQFKVHVVVSYQKFIKSMPRLQVSTANGLTTD